MTSETLLEIRSLTVKYRTRVREVKALDGVNLQVATGEIVALVGESACGKSTLGLSIIGLLPQPPAVVESGEILFAGRDLLRLRESQIAAFRGTRISMIFQEPMSSLDPVYRVGDLIAEAIDVREKRKVTRPFGPFEMTNPAYKDGRDGGFKRVFGVRNPRSNRKRAYSAEVVEALRKVQIADPAKTQEKYPHELSGGMAQRVMIAQALIEGPSLLIADEPTSALDVTTQAEVLNLMRSLRDEIGASIIFITHDLAVAAQIADRVAVMYAGDIVELANVGDLFRQPQHPYTEGLINSFPRQFKDEGGLEAIPGEVPDYHTQIVGCKFNPRCRYALDRCRVAQPDLIEVRPSQKAACFLRYPE
ncbi:MAG TPA: ABC transporter ATP-binding protein [Nitrososphaerales archaeon]|nr:ABC transporter ATP-binding protein [Nitrososphaerales archaeon]